MRAAAAILAILVALAGSRAGGGDDPYPLLSGGVIEYVVQQGDSLRSLGSRLGIDPATLAGDNGLAATSAVVAGQRLIADNRHIVPSSATDGLLVVNIPQRMLFLRSDDAVFGAPIAVGRRAWATPVSAFVVRAKETDPTWDVPESIAAEARAHGRTLPAKVPPGPTNPLGRHWLGLSIGGIGIHGTNAPLSVYRTVTHGCIRLHADDIASLFERVAVGTRGQTIYEPVLIADLGHEVFLEVHPDVYRRRAAPPLAQVRAVAVDLGIVDRIDWSAVERVIAARAGVARPVTSR